MSVHDFKKSFTALNAQQQAAVEAIEGPVMVLAGPGTGKTQVLTLRIANILQQTDTAPENILALTYTEAATTAMRARLLQWLGPTAYKVRIHTFHSFCQQILEQHAEYFPFQPGALRMIDEIEQQHLITSFMERPEINVLRTPSSVHHFVKDIVQRISELKREAITPDAFATHVQQLASEQADGDDKRIAQLQELSLMYRWYHDALRERVWCDFDDTIMLVLEALQQDTTLQSLVQEQCHYILVDEFQDINAAQMGIVFALSAFWGEQANVFAVGDPHQTIYRFQGIAVASGRSSTAGPSGRPQASATT
jgi:DNA helicase-2/ATP-dependent DNA helicase PcrA